MNPELINLEQEYAQLKKQLERVEDCETLKKYYILSKAQKVGYKLYGRTFTLHQLALDFEIPFTTTKRVMSLAKANKTTWGLIKQKKISVFKVAMILMSKDTTYQDEIIDMVIKNNLSTYQIKKIRIRDYKDIKKTRTQLAVAQGFSRKHEAYYKLLASIDRTSQLLLINKNHLTKNNKSALRTRLNKLNKRIKIFLEDIN